LPSPELLQTAMPCSGGAFFFILALKYIIICYTYSTISEILDIVHEMAQDLFKAGAMDEITLRQVKAA
jgi:hypothetical protein